MIKALITDLDGTLLHSDKTISDHSIELLNKCRSLNIKIAFATGRPVRTVAKYLTQIPCDAVIYHNGAFILSNNALIGEVYQIPIHEVRWILSLLQDKYPYRRLSVEINDVIYSNFDIADLWGYTEAVQTDFSDLPDQDADKMLIEISSADDFNEIVSLLPPHLYGQLCEGRICLVMNNRATKLNAIKKLSQHWDIDLSEMIAFGDDYNDIEMIKYCGLGVAVGNAIDEVLAVADIITDTNDNDGVAKYISKLVLMDHST